MQYDVNQAWATLQATGRVSLQGAPAFWSKSMSVLIKVLFVFVGLLFVLVIAGFFIAVSSGAVDSAASIAGFAGGLILPVLLGGLVYGRWHRQRSTYREYEEQPVVLEAAGLTLRGLGPIPWHDFGMAQRQIVRAEHDSESVWRAVLPLTQSGFHIVNQVLAAELRDRIAPVAGIPFDRAYRNVYVPGVEGMKLKDVMWLINSARKFFQGR